MSPDKAREELRNLAKFQITKFHYFLAALATLSILTLGISSFIESRETVTTSKVLSDVETPAASIIFTQRETLVYATRLAQWSNGGTTRREVQIARNLLAQRLAVIDTSGKSMGDRADSGYWKALKESDAIVASSTPGFVPEAMHDSLTTALNPVIDEILAEARQLVVSYQRSVDQEILRHAQLVASRDNRNLLLFYIFLVAGGLFLFLNVRLNFKNYRIARVVLDREHHRLEDAIAELRKLQNTVVELKDLNEAKNAFIATVNHELRTPLTSIIGYLDVMRDELDTTPDPSTVKYLDVLDRNAQILLNLVESMLSLSKIDSGKGALPDIKVSLNEVIDNAIFIMKPSLENSEIKIIVTSEEVHLVRGDVGQLNQVFINLLGNAVKFSPRGSSIDISLVNSEGIHGESLVAISVRDHGIGIPPEDLEKLFTRFFRARNAVSQQYPGTGLGLSIVKQVVELHNGEIKVESGIGTGTTFTITLPHYPTPEELLIQARRGDVLKRAIASLVASTNENLIDVTHEIGGAIGFYGFTEEGNQLLDFSRRNKKLDQPDGDAFASEKAHMLSLLYSALEKTGHENE